MYGDIVPTSKHDFVRIGTWFHSHFSIYLVRKYSHDLFGVTVIALAPEKYLQILTAFQACKKIQ